MVVGLTDTDILPDDMTENLENYSHKLRDRLELYNQKVTLLRAGENF